MEKTVIRSSTTPTTPSMVTMYEGDGVHMVSSVHSDSATFAFLRGIYSNHIAVCYRGPFTVAPRNAVRQPEPRWFSYMEAVRDFFSRLNGGPIDTQNIMYSQRQDSSSMMTCHYTSAPISRRPSDEEIQEFIAHLSTEFGNMPPPTYYTGPKDRTTQDDPGYGSMLA